MRAWMVVLGLLLAGCAQPDEAQPVLDDEIAVEPGQIRGVVVDEAIRPVDGATVTLVGTGRETTTGPDGQFVFEDVSPGTYFVEATHPLYDTQQTSVEVPADGVAKSVAVKLQRLITQDPYTSQLQLKGYLVCSSNVGGVIAEECGEGVGAPCTVAGQPVPVIGCQRIGGTPENVPEVTFFTDGNHIRTIQAEVVWEPSFQINDEIQSGGFTVIMAVNHICDPVCRYDERVDDKVGQSPIIMRTDDGPQGGGYFGGEDASLEEANLTAEDSISVFVWQTDEDLAGVTFDQTFEVLVTLAYYLPLPEGWAMVNNDSPPR